MQSYLTPKKELIIKLFCLIIIIILCLAIYFNGKTLDCEKCIVKFKTQDRFSNQEINFSVPIKELYFGLLNETCLVESDNNGGYFFKHEFK